MRIQRPVSKASSNDWAYGSLLPALFYPDFRKGINVKFNEVRIIARERVRRGLSRRGLKSEQRVLMTTTASVPNTIIIPPETRLSRLCICTYTNAENLARELVMSTHIFNSG